MKVAGLDGCKLGWIAVVAEVDDLDSIQAMLIVDIAEFLDAEGVDRAIIDIPIGLVDGDVPRDVEAAMRAALPGKASSVFNTPCREALLSDDYFEASDINERQLGVRLSKQTFALFPKMRELDALVRERGQSVIREGHPEVSFAILNESPVLSRKKDRDGQMDRLRLLVKAGLDPSPLLDQARQFRCGIDDILDATALLWSAVRWARNTTKSYPPVPVRDSAGLEMSVIA